MNHDTTNNTGINIYTGRIDRVLGGREARSREPAPLVALVQHHQRAEGHEGEAVGMGAVDVDEPEHGRVEGEGR